MFLGGLPQSLFPTNRNGPFVTDGSARRAFLRRSVAGLIVGLAGCQTVTDPEPTPTTTRSPTPTPLDRPPVSPPGVLIPAEGDGSGRQYTVQDEQISSHTTINDTNLTIS
jgi:hypothetical protein